MVMTSAKSLATRTLALIAGCLLLVVAIHGDVVIPMYESEPYDQVTLVEKYKSKPLKIYPLENRDRAQRVNPDPDAELRIRLLDYPDRLFDVAWKDIERLDFFDELVLKEAIRLVSVGDFDAAFHHFEFLRKESPDVPGLEEAIERFLFTDASTAFRTGKLHESLAILEELYRLDPGRAGAQQGIQRVVRALFRQYMDKKEYRSAQQMIAWAAQRFGRESLGATLSSWEQELSELAAERKKQAQTAIQQGNLREAYRTSNEMMAIWPTLEGAPQLSLAIAERYPVAKVGVTSLGATLDPRRFDDWAARRAGRLTQRLIVENHGYGSEGGIYASPFADLQRSDNGMSLILKVRPDINPQQTPELSGFGLVQRILQLSNPDSPDFSPTWSEVVQNVRVDDVYNVQADMRKPFLQPAALLQIPVATDTNGKPVHPSQPYELLERTEKLHRYGLNPDYCLAKVTQPREVVEHVFSESSLAIQALRAGEIDAVDRVYPADLGQLRSADGIAVGSYSVPSLHMLVPNYQRPYPSSRTFRRALEYGINRETLLREDLLGKAQVAGCRLISGPLPAGRSTDDSIAYAYDATIAPRPYEPRLAVTLAAVARSELAKAAEKSGETPPAPPSLILVYPDAEIPRVACAGIAQYLSAVGIPCTAQPLPTGLTFPTDDIPWDFVYLEVVMVEPAIDIRRLLGINGVSRGASPYLEAAMRRLVTAANWDEARKQLNEIHRLAYEEVAVLPLWQLVDHFAYRSTLAGVAATPLTLYENIEGWQVPPVAITTNR